MSKLQREHSRGELRSWLKLFQRTNLAERLPPTHEPSGMSPAGYANSLLAKFGTGLNDPQARPDSEAAAETREFRRWVDDRLKKNRRTILGETTDPDVVDYARPTNPFEQDSVPQATTVREFLREMGWDQPDPEPDPASTPTDSRYDPMWDEFLDGP
jgi:hypothetical protein